MKRIQPIPHLEKIITPKVNFRTKYKLSYYCCICGSSTNVQYHHVKHIKVVKVTGFLQIMKQYNRKQIPVCAICHKKIHKGEYDNIPLSDLIVNMTKI